MNLDELQALHEKCQEEFDRWWNSLGDNLPKNGVVAAAWPDKDDCWATWQAARAPLLEENARREAAISKQILEMDKAWRAEVAKRDERITALEAKCALLAASWKKAEDRAVELEKTVRKLSEPVEASWPIPAMTSVCAHCGSPWTDDHPDVCTGR
jgi:hypothetical protein